MLVDAEYVLTLVTGVDLIVTVLKVITTEDTMEARVMVHIMINDINFIIISHNLFRNENNRKWTHLLQTAIKQPRKCNF